MVQLEPFYNSIKIMHKSSRQTLNELQIRYEMETDPIQKLILKEQIQDLQFHILKHGDYHYDDEEFNDSH